MSKHYDGRILGDTKIISPTQLPESLKELIKDYVEQILEERKQQ